MSEKEDNNGNPFPLRVRIVQVFFLVIAVIATLCLAWWQWSRWQSNGGSFQNLGYAIQWPIFGGFLVFAYRKYIEYEKERLNGEEQAAVPKQRREAMTEIPDDFLQNLHQTGHAPVDVSQREVRDTRRSRSRSTRPGASADTPSPGSHHSSKPANPTNEGI